MPNSRICREGEKGAFAPIPGTGTTIAIKSYRLPDAKPGFSGWGGARKRLDPVSRALTFGQVELLFGAAQFALHIALPFNRHITIHWKIAGIADDGAAAATRRFIKRAGDWVSGAGGRFAAAWAREGGQDKGSHVHILAHIPIALSGRFKRMPMRWLRSIRATVRHERGTILTRRIGGTVRAAETASAHYRANLGSVLAYVAKGASVAAAAAFNLTILEDGGPVIGKRAGTTENIGRAAWRRARWQPAMLANGEIANGSSGRERRP